MSSEHMTEENMSFRIIGLSPEPFARLFDLSDEDLAACGAVRRVADDRTPGYPCRVSLTDARPGDELLLVNYEHHPVASPYRMRFAIFVRKGEEQFDAIDQVPDQLRTRQLAVRAFDANGMMLGHELVDGARANVAITINASHPSHPSQIREGNPLANISRALLISLRMRAGTQNRVDAAAGCAGSRWPAPGPLASSHS
jgi:hypothetical protein